MTKSGKMELGGNIYGRTL